MTINFKRHYTGKGYTEVTHMTYKQVKKVSAQCCT
jgi:hypothetical protein